MCENKEICCFFQVLCCEGVSAQGSQKAHREHQTVTSSRLGVPTLNWAALSYRFLRGCPVRRALCVWVGVVSHMHTHTHTLTYTHTHMACTLWTTAYYNTSHRQPSGLNKRQRGTWWDCGLQGQEITSGDPGSRKSRTSTHTCILTFCREVVHFYGCLWPMI